MGFLKKGIRTLAAAAALCLLLAALPAPVWAQEAQNVQDSQAAQETQTVQDSQAAQETQTGQNSQTVLTTKVNGHPDTVEKGSGEVTLDDGTAVTVEGASLPDGLLFVVEHILEEENGEIHDWVGKCMEGLGTNLRVYDIYFVDSNGQRYEVDGQITVTISLNGGYRNPSVYYVSGQGSVTRMESSVSDGRISFTTTHNSYYVLAEQPEGGNETEAPGETETETEAPDETETETETEAPGETESETETEKTGGKQTENTGTSGKTPGNSSGSDAKGTAAKTGDETDLVLWILLCGGSVMVLLICAAGKKKKQRRVP